MSIHKVNNTPIGAKVFVNVNLVDHAFYADTDKGIVRYYPSPIRIKRGSDTLYHRELHGNVEVILPETK